jgi:hypothetical protein
MAVALKMFSPSAPVPWLGRYARIPGITTVFHLKYIGGKLCPVVIWRIYDDVVTCPALHCPSIDELATTVARAKRHAGGDGGGAFMIDEFGHVIVPANDGSGRKFLAGRYRGAIQFENPLEQGAPFDLAGDAYLQSGDPWKLPYVGMPYHLHRNGSIYFYQQDEHGGRSVYPRQQDLDLIRSIRNIRPRGPVRILVTHAGAVLTKVPSGAWGESEENWQAVYVGSIDLNLWFDKE